MYGVHICDVVLHSNMHVFVYFTLMDDISGVRVPYRGGILVGEKFSHQGKI